MTRSEAMNDARMEQAASWWAKFQESEPAAEDIAAWVAWMEEDESNAEAFRSMNDLALCIRHTRAVQPERLRALRPATAPRSMFRRKLAVAASVVATVGAVSTLVFTFGPGVGSESRTDPPMTYTTQTAAQRAVLLPDGSRVTLGGASTIAIDFSSKRRHVSLAAGEAYFEVAHESSGRAFVVDTGLATVQAVGTAFNIRRNDNRIAVTVTEGRVKVDRAGDVLTKLAVAAGLETKQTIEVSQDQQVIVEIEDAPLTVAAADPQRAMSWQRGRLEFVDEPLDAVISSVSRYSTKSLVADDPRLRAITYTGSFVPERFDSWLGALETVFPVEVSRDGDAITVRARSGSQ